jgi:CRP/FNR family transcriptional regulator
MRRLTRIIEAMSADNNKINTLRQTKMFGELDDESLRRLAERAVERHLSSGEILFVTGEEAHGLYVVAEGAVRAVRVNLDGREQVIHVERAPTTIAEVPAFDDEPFPSTAIAETESTVFFIDKRDVQRLCLEHPQIALAALKLIAGRLRRCAELVEVLSLREVGQRLARLLLAEARASGTRTDEGFLVNLSLNNQHIAARVGTVREVISRTFTKLQQDGFIRLEGRSLTILDENALAAYADER